MDIEIRPAALPECDAAATFLQSGFWASFKAGFGWKPLPFVLSIPGQAELPLLVMVRGLGAGMSFAYVPHGPCLSLAEARIGPDEDGADLASGELLTALAAKLKAFLPSNALFLRFDPAWYHVEAVRDLPDPPATGGAQVEAEEARPEEVDRPSYPQPFRRSAADVQPPDTVLLDLRQTEAELLAAMKPKWRYNIKLAEKKGILVAETKASGDWRPALGKFYELYRETSERDRIALHPESYYAKLFETAASHEGGKAGAKPDLRLWTASHEGDVLAAIITIFWGSQAVYLYGASSNEKRNLMPAYALQWAAIRAAREAGCAEYDFYGIPPTDSPDHPMAGLYRFKTGFGGRIAHRGGSWDYPLKPLLYEAFRGAETLRTWYYKDFRKRK